MEQPAELESAAYIVETAATTAYDTPNVTVPTSTPNAYTLDSWRVNVTMSPDSLYVGTDADPLPSWSENALGTLSVNVGMIEFTTDAPVIVRMYNTVKHNKSELVECPRRPRACGGNGSTLSGATHGLARPTTMRTT
jgi:hypothetical protein